MDKPRARSTRVDVDFDAVFTSSNGEQMNAVVKDVSARGFKLQVSDELISGERVSLQAGKDPPGRAIS